MRSSLKDHIEWLYIEKPSKDDFRFLEASLALPVEVAEALREPSLRPRFVTEGDLRYLVLHLPIYDAKKRRTRAVEIDVLALNDTVATVAFERVPLLHELARGLQKNKEKQKELLGKTSDHLLHEIITRFLDFVDRELDHIQEKLDLLEEELTLEHAHRKDLLEELALLRGDILDVRRIVKPEREVFGDLAHAGGNRFKTLLDEYDRLFGRIENHKETIEALYDTFTALVSMRATEVMRVLTIIATITLPLALFTSLFGMNTVHTPLIGSPFDFWLILGIITLSTLSMLAVFKEWKWF